MENKIVLLLAVALRHRVVAPCFLLFPVLALAQFENGSLVGTVRDATGAVVPAAGIAIINMQTGINASAVTSNDGNWEVPSVRVGQYRVTVNKEGFQPAIAENVTLSVGSRQRVDLTLAIGGAHETIQVSGVNLELESDSSQRGQIVTNYQTEALPLINRNYSSLVPLATGVRVSQIGIGTLGGLTREASFNVEGQRSPFNNFLLDGLDNNAYGESNQGFSNQVTQPPPDSVAQFQVVTNNESAEYGRASGATVNVATLTGTNRFHATAYEFLRNTALNATGYFKPAGDKKPQFNRNQFGGNFGGPILRDKAFFFADYEGFRQIRKLLALSAVPTALDRSGNFSTSIKNPFTGQVYPANEPIDPRNFSPAALRILQSIPAPNYTGPGSTPNSYAQLQRFQNYSDKFDIRFDAQLTQKTSSFFRLSQRKETAIDFTPLPLPIDGGSNGKQRILDQQIAAGFTYQVRPNQLLDARLGVDYTKGGKFTLSLGTPADFGIANLPQDPVLAGGLPTILINGFSAYGRQATNPQWQYPRTYDPKVNYTWIAGAHSLKFGYEYLHTSMVVQDVNPLYGRFIFVGNFSGNNFADFLFGAPSRQEISTFFIAYLRQVQHFAYLQDDWKVLPSLTLNLGLRYEYGSPYWEKHNNLSNFDPLTSPVTGQLLRADSGDTYQRSLVDPDLNNFAPRFGFDYATGSRTAIRGGFGISYIHFNRAGSGNLLAINAPQVLFVVQNQTPPAVNGATDGYRSLDQGIQPGVTNPSNFNPLTANITYMPRTYRSSYVESYFLSVQRQLAKNVICDVAYVGNHSLKLLEFANYNQANPALGVNPATRRFNRPISTFGDITYAFNGGYGNYNSLQVRYEQRFVAGLTLLNSFTWSRTFDNASQSLENSNGNFPGPQDINNLAADYGPSQYDQPLNNTTSFVYDLPLGEGRRYLDRGGFLDEILGGWQISGINTMLAGQPLTVIYNPAAANQVSGITADFRGANNYRPNRTTAHIRAHTAGQPTVVLNPAAFTTVGLGTDSAGNPLSPFGNAGRDLARSDPFYNLDIAANKSFSLADRAQLEFRAELYNFLNKTNFLPPATTFGNSNFGKISGNFDPRLVQFGLKFTY